MFSELEKINRFAKKELSEDEVYIFKVNLCNNDIDRDFEKFSLDSLNELKELFVGKTGIFDHEMKSENQTARLFDVEVEKEKGKKTLDGEDFYNLVGKAYMLKNEKNKSLIEEIEGGIKKEISISCKVNEKICSICGADKNKKKCAHVKGKTYENRLCFDVLNDAVDAYEFSFVAIPAQREAKIVKSYFADGEKTKQNDFITEDNMENIIKIFNSNDGDIVISKAQKDVLMSYIDLLEREQGEVLEYKNELKKELVKLYSRNNSGFNKNLFLACVDNLSIKELNEVKREILKSEKEKNIPSPQIINRKSKTNNSQFKF